MSLNADTFVDLWKPKFPYSSNNLAQEGLYRTKRDIALSKRYIETAPKFYRNLIVVDWDKSDIDRHFKMLAFDEGLIPEPNYTTTFLGSGNGQAGYYMPDFASSLKAIEFFNDVAKGLTIITGGDLAYGGRTMRNPLHESQQTNWGTDKLYTLKELNEYASKAKSYDVPIDKEREVGVGRNEAMFEALRKWAYRERLKYDTYSEWCIAAEERANELNFSLDTPLPSSEVRTIVNSTVKWVWKNFSQETFSKIQRARSRRREVVKNAPERDRAILDMDSAGFSISDIADNLGVSYSAGKTALYTARKRYPNGIVPE